MTINYRNASLFSVLLIVLSFTGPLLRAQTKRPVKKETSGIQVKMIRSDAALPAEFQVSLYENLIDQLQKKAVFKGVFRDGDRSAENGDDLITLQCSVVKFKKGNETLRNVTTVAGATSMTLRCEFMDKAGNTVLARDITGNVRFFGGNLKATYDFAKKAAKVADENFSSSAVAARS